MNSTCQPNPSVRATMRLLSSKERPPRPLVLMRNPLKPPSFSSTSSESVIDGSSRARPLKLPFMRFSASRVMRIVCPVAAAGDDDGALQAEGAMSLQIIVQC